MSSVLGSKVLSWEDGLIDLSTKRERVKSTRVIRIPAETFTVILANMYQLSLKNRKQLLIKDALFMSARFYMNCDSETQMALVYGLGKKDFIGRFAFERTDKFVVNLFSTELDLLDRVAHSIGEIKGIHLPMSQTIVILLLLIPALVD